MNNERRRYACFLRPRINLALTRLTSNPSVSMHFIRRFDCQSHLTSLGGTAASARQAVVATLAVDHHDAFQRAPPLETETLYAGGIAAAAITN